ncbi:autotransporter-associated beta strand repeat-containing protein [Maribellus mangrovi]|uniref:rhamnogalacturonan lyase family protein n=1 Tax=Maribellus mangrovi TaxID=3133146 RepID=UPI0030EBC5E7
MRLNNILLTGLLLVFFFSTQGQRKMEKLGRGVVAVRTETGSAFISWRLFGTESWDTGFNIYKDSGGGEPVKLNNEVLIKGTNFTDNTLNSSVNNSYFIKPVVNGVEQEASNSYTLKANTSIEPCIVLPLKSGAEIHFVWVGDLDGDGEYDYIVDRLQWGVGCKIEAYKGDGTYLWTIDLGPNSSNMDNISPGSSAIDVGNWDGVTVYDMDEDGKAEVMVRTANGVVFGDGSVLQHNNNNVQFVSVIDGLTGMERARAEIPNSYISVGPLACSMGVGYLNGITPSLVTFFKNRNSDKSFNRLMCAWDFNGTDIELKWKTNMPFGTSYGDGSDGHQMRIIDLDGDGKDEVAHIGFVLNGEDGSLYYNMGDYGIQHGDRWFVGKLDPTRPGLQGYGIQQYNSILDYYYDAGTGELIWKHTTPDGGIGDVGRGSVGDVDPSYPGYEVWEFGGLYNAPSNTRISSSYAYPNLRIWWDGDLLSENLNDGKLEKYLYQSKSVSRLLTTWHYHSATGSARAVPMFYGDIMGDWREEIIYTNSSFSQLVIFTTPVETNHRIYTLPHNPAYRNGMTIKGYMQSHMLDYFLGANMNKPPTPPIQTAKCIWKGSETSNIWELDGQENWIVGDTLGIYAQGDDVLFDISANPDTSVWLNGEIMPSDIKVITPINYHFNGDGTLAGNTGLIKAGNGKLYLDCRAAYTGITSIEEGVLYLNDTLTESKVIVYPGATFGGNGVVNQPVSLMSGSVLSPGLKGQTGILTLNGDLMLPENASLFFDISNDSSGMNKISDSLAVKGNITFSGLTSLIINKTEKQVEPGNYPLITYSGTLTGDLDKIEIQGLYGQKYSLTTSDQTIWLKIEGSRNPGTVTWNGKSNVWDLLTTPNWTLEKESVTFVANDTVIFDGSGESNQTINIDGELPVSAVIVSDTTGVNYTFNGSGSISGNASLVKTGSGRLSLLNTNSYKGKTVINGGSLEVNKISESGMNSSIGANESVSPAEFIINNANFIYSGSNLALTNKGMTLSGNSDTINVKRSSATFVIEGVLAGTGNLVKKGTGTLTLKAANTFKGNTYIDEGELFLGNETANAAGLNRGSVTFGNGILSMSSGGYTEFTSDLIVPENASGTLNTDDRCNYRGRLTGSGTFNLNLPGTKDRTIFFGNWSAFSGTINITGASNTRFRIANSYGYENATINLGYNIGMYHGGTGTTGGDSQASVVKIGALGSKSSSRLYDENWVIGSNNKDCLFPGIIEGRSLKKVGSGTLTLRGKNTYSGGTIIEGGTLMAITSIGSSTGSGTVQVKNNGTLAGTATIHGSTTILSGGNLTPGKDGIGSIGFDSNLTLNQGSSVIIEVDDNSNDKIEVSGTFNVSGKLTINKTDTAGFKNGDELLLFTASKFSGEFEEIIPSIPGEGLQWDTSELYTEGKLKVSSITGEKIIHNASGKLKIFPNPVNDHLFIKSVNGELIQDITFHSLNGTKVFEKEINSYEESVDLSELARGIYFVKVRFGNDVIIQKISKQ